MKACISAALCALTILAGASSADAASATVDRFSDTAGFQKARVGPIEERSPITVGLAPEFWGDPQSVQDRIDWLDPVLDAWNTAAGWAMFVQVNDATTDVGPIPDVTFSTDAETKCPPGAGACAWMTERTYVGFDHCYVAFWPWYPTPDVVAHELGHCLGFICPGVAPLDPDYHGVMTHDRPWGLTPDNEWDRASLVEAGYRT